MNRLLPLVLIAIFACSSEDPSGYELPPPPSGKMDDYGSSDAKCGIYGRASVDTADYLCLGVVAGDNDSRFQPRVLMELPDRPYEMLVTDLAAWGVGKGRIWYLDARQSRPTMKVVLDGLTLPHQIIKGPEGWIYFGEDTKISAFPATALDEDGDLDRSQIKVVVDGLPPMDVDAKRNSFHPISHFVFDIEGNLFVNVGAYSDHCDAYEGQTCLETDGNLIDGEESDEPHHWGGVIRRYDFEGSFAAGWSKDWQVVAMGLRNSMGLAFTPQGDLLQVENGRDFRDGGKPFEELNVIRKAELYGNEPAKHFGWPYCYDVYETSEEWANYDGFDCTPSNPDYRPPHILLPPHGAPLGLTYYNGRMFGELQGKLIVPLHGYRAPGQRILAFDVDDNGLPVRSEGATYLENPSGAGLSVEREYPTHAEGLFSAQAEHVVSAWFKVDGIRPKGAPVAPIVASDGSIWIADDKNRTILRMGRSEEAGPPIQRVDMYPFYEEALENDTYLRSLYDNMLERVIRADNCQGCHDDFRLKNDQSIYPELRYLLALGTWVRPGDPNESTLYKKLTPPGETSMPPVGREWQDQATGEAAVESIYAFISAMPEFDAPEPEPIPYNKGWIGGACEKTEDCDYDNAYCHKPDEGPGYCSLECTLESPYCPDRDGNAATFCIDRGDGVGHCVGQCEDPTVTCLEGQSCDEAMRFGQAKVKLVCQ